MSLVQFKQVFTALMLLSLVSAFILPPRATEIGRSPFQSLLIPISRPTYKLANAVRGHFETKPVEDTRPTAAIEQENLALKQQVQRLNVEIEQLEQRAAERASLGGFETYCDRFVTSAADTNGHDGITITGTKIADVKEDQPVLSSGGVIDLLGRVNATHGLAAHVRLLTDPGFAVTGHFVSFSTTSGAQENQNLLAIVTGRGAGQIAITNLHTDEVKGIQPGDWLILRDETYPHALQGVRIARVATIQPLAKQPLFADIELIPADNYVHLNDVWVMTHQP